MTISGGVDRTSLPNSDDDMDIVDSTDVSNWDEELAITSFMLGDEHLSEMTKTEAPKKSNLEWTK